MENVGREERGTEGREAGTRGAKGKEKTEERMKEVRCETGIRKHGRKQGLAFKD